jgi:hypothetical protein
MALSTSSSDAREISNSPLGCETRGGVAVLERSGCRHGAEASFLPATVKAGAVAIELGRVPAPAASTSLGAGLFAAVLVTGVAVRLLAASARIL